MTDGQPPSYDEITKLIKKIQGNPPNADGLAKAYQAMAKKAGSPETRALLKDEVNKLAGAASDITSGFATVLGALMKVDSNEYKEADGVTPVPKLAGGWRKLSEQWTEIYTISRKTASDTAYYVERMLKLIIPMLKEEDSKISFQSRINTLEKFIKKERPETVSSIDLASKDAQLHSDAFGALSIQVREYSQKFDKFAEAQGIAFQADITTLKADIAELDKAIKKQEEAIFEAGVAMGVTVFGTAVGAIGALLTLGPAGPAAAGGIVMTGIATLGTEGAALANLLKQKNTLRDERATVKSDLDTATANLKELVHLRAVLDTAKVEIGAIAARIDQFANVWGLIARDAEIIANDLKAAQQVPRNDEFEDKVELIKVSYEALKVALNDYVLTTKPVS